MNSFKRIRAGAAGLAALVALAFGGSALANAAQTAPNSTPAAVTSTVDVPTAGDKPDGAADVATPGDKADSQTDVATAGDKADNATDVATAGDKADSAAESGSEIPGADGPGHADETPAQR